MVSTAIWISTVNRPWPISVKPLDSADAAVGFDHRAGALPYSTTPLPMPTFLMPQAMPDRLALLARGVIVSLHRLQRLAAGRRLVERLAAAEDVAVAQARCASASPSASMPSFLGQHVEAALDREAAIWLTPKPRIAPQGGLLV